MKKKTCKKCGAAIAVNWPGELCAACMKKKR